MKHIRPVPDQAQHSIDIGVLLALADPCLTEEGAEELRRTMTEHATGIDWSWLLDQGSRHRVLPLMGYNIKTFRLYWAESGEDLMPNHWVYTSVYEGNRLRNEALAKELAALLRSFNDSGIPYAVRKGLLLAERFYPDLGTRRVSDFDILVTAADARALAAPLQELGYVQGVLHADARIRPYQRSTEAFWRLHVNNALPYVKKTTEPGLAAFIVDLCLSVLPGRESRTVGSEEFLARSVPATTCGVPTRALGPADELLDLCQHLYKEADTSFYIASSQDIALSKFIDVVRALRDADEATLTAFVDRAHHYDVARNVYFALVHTAELYPGTVPGWVEERLRPEDLSYLDEYGNLEGNVRTWQHGFLQRAFDSRRVERMEGGSSVPLR
ncbi:nucleotidyltransferase family protein [Streptomyces rubiginosohelvolus]|uniref:nucleotidyltransferase family protein n=1 Tax=Streptomyces rubiginosohelvolus TaxID=67362 RepID=UPI0037939B26